MKQSNMKQKQTNDNNDTKPRATVIPTPKQEHTIWLLCRNKQSWNKRRRLVVPKQTTIIITKTTGQRNNQETNNNNRQHRTKQHQQHHQQQNIHDNMPTKHQSKRLGAASSAASTTKVYGQHTAADTTAPTVAAPALLELHAPAAPGCPCCWSCFCPCCQLLLLLPLPLPLLLPCCCCPYCCLLPCPAFADMSALQKQTKRWNMVSKWSRWRI